MLQMTDMPQRKRRITPEEAIIRNEPQPEKTMITLNDLPKRGRTRITSPVPQGGVPTKILTISDLPRRADAMRRDTIEARKRQAMTKTHSNMLLGPKIFADYVHNGAWKGRRCFIIGGGPSIKDVDLSSLVGELTIGINRAYEICDPSILFGVDGQMWGWVEQGKCGEESKRKFNEYRGYKVWMALHKVFPPDFYLIDVDEDGGYRIGSTARLAFKNNSGYGAINLAAALGANPIYLLGFDMQGDKQGKQKWWHDGYPVDYGENVYKRYIDEITNFAPTLKQAGFDVINLNPKSALKCFEFGNYREVVKHKPVIPEDAISVMTKPGMITAITPTGDRPLAFALCKHWMETQTVRPDQWIVVDDGKVPTRAPAGSTYIRRTPLPNDPVYTLNLNLKTAIPHIRGNKILIIEDDEYYAPDYVKMMAQALEGYEVAGIMASKYYHIGSNGYAQHGNTIHASLAQTGFRSQFLNTFTALLDSELTTYLDIRVWRTAMNNSVGYLFADGAQSLYAGIKGLPGRHGIGIGHDPAMYKQNLDNKHAILRKWIPRDYQVYLDVQSGKLNDANCNTYFPQITGITVCQNTRDFMQRAYESVRKFHPDMPIIIIDGSDATDPCAEYVKSLRSNLTTVIQPGYNIGHGRGMCLGIDHAKTPYALIFDSDIEMLKSPVNAMLGMMELDTFGVGYTEKTAPDGFEWGACDTTTGQSHTDGEPMRMLHPYFQLINIPNYRKYHPYVHHGAPCYLTCLDIHKKGLSDKIIKEFPGLGHSSGKGWVWTGQPREYIRHDPAGTRGERVRHGLGEIEGDWVVNRGQV